MRSNLSCKNNSNTSRFYKAFLTVFFLTFLLCAFSVGGCSGTKSVPTDFETIELQPTIFPDYRDVTIPVNIAPMNFDICNRTAETALTVVSIADNKGEVLKENLAVFSGKKVRFSPKFWKKTLQDNVGNSLLFSVFVKSEGKWRKFSNWTMTISSDVIDPWISYRKIEPGYEYFTDLALWNRSLESFDERAFFRARLVNERTCTNCHSYQNYGTNAFFFHLRFHNGGTVFNVNGELAKRDLMADGMLSGCSYSAWRPNSLHIAFVSCQTFQVFHTKSDDRIDVLDAFSDLYLYDVVKNTIKPVFTPSDDTLDTYPTWSADGKTLYYCSAKNPGFKTSREDLEKRKSETIDLREKLHYDIKKVSYDEKTGTFSEPELVFDASSNGQSALFPRLSPDGKTLLFTLTRYGCFPIWYRDANLWTLNLESGEARALDEVNSSEESDSYHSWSSSGRWIVFASRRDDGSVTRLFFAHFGESGRFSKPFMLPQKDPRQTLEEARSYNLPEFTLEPVKIPSRALLEEAKKTDPEKAILESL